MHLGEELAWSCIHWHLQRESWQWRQTQGDADNACVDCPRSWTGPRPGHFDHSQLVSTCNF
eukprot:3844737-Rhodomonas_salina.1